MPCVNPSNEPVIRLRDISLSRDERVILSDINLEARRGDLMAITGPNGGGKTTLLRIILGLQRPDAGSVEYFGADGAVARQLKFGYLPQKNSIDARFPITTREVISSGLLSSKGMPRSERDRRIEEALELMELTSHADHPIGALSGGQLQRAMMGRALISRPEVLVFDEPLSYLDSRFEQRTYDIISSLPKDTTVIIVSHQMSVLAGITTRHFIVDRTLSECHAHHHHAPVACD